MICYIKQKYTKTKLFRTVKKVYENKGITFTGLLIQGK